MRRCCPLRLSRAAVLLLPALLVAGSVAGAWAEDGVGVASAVDQSARSQRGAGPLKTVRIGKAVFQNERIRTGGSGLVQVLLADGSNFLIGPNSDLVIDEFVYQPAGTSRMIATFGKGVARYVGGKLSKTRGGVTIRTRQGTIGVRGGMANLLDRGDRSIYSFLFGKDLTFVGRDGRKLRVYRPGFAIEASGGAGRVIRTPPSMTREVAQLLTGRGGSGQRPSPAALQRFSGANSALPPQPGQPIPAPVILSTPRRAPDGYVDYNRANQAYAGPRKVLCMYGC